MKNCLKRIMTIAAVICMMLQLCAPACTYAAQKFKVHPTSIVLLKGKTAKIRATGAGKAKVKWSTSNKKVAAISKKGIVTARKAGKATISAKAGKIVRKCKITVKNRFSIVLKNYTGEQDGDSHSITLSNVPEGTALYYRTDTKDAWSKEKPSRIEAGTTKVYVKAVKTNYKTFTGSATITIKEAPVKIDKVEEEGLITYLKVINGKVYDLVTGEEKTGFAVDGDYFKTGTISVGKDLIQWTYEMILDYDESSNKGVLGSMSFRTVNGVNAEGVETTKYEECDNIFKLNEIDNPVNNGRVRVPWVPDSYNSGYYVSVPARMNAYLSSDGEILAPGDSFWSFSMDSKNGKLNSRINGAKGSATMKSYTDAQGETRYVNKIFRNSVSLTGAHKIKEIKIYDKALTEEEQEEHYKETGIAERVKKRGSSPAINGVEELGTLIYEKEDDTHLSIIPSEKTPGTHTFIDSTGQSKNYTIKEYTNPDTGIDNSAFESVHITNKIDEIICGKEYPLTAYAYPSTTADPYDVTWESSDPSVLAVIDGLLIAKKTGSAMITATLTGTDIQDAFTISVIDAPKAHTNVFSVPESYVSQAGNSFSDVDYSMTTRAIYDAITEAKQNGYNKVVFPAIKFYAQPVNVSLGTAFKIPSEMTIEFPEGSEFHMMDNDISRGDPTKVEIHYFEFAADEKDNPCENSHLIIDKFFGERYDTTHSEKEFLEENRFAQFGRKAINCSVEIRDAYKPAGYFVTADGTSPSSMTDGVLLKSDMVSGLYDEDADSVVENENWISSGNFVRVPEKVLKDGYFLSVAAKGAGANKYWRGCAARLYNIYWFDAEKKFISKDEFLGVGDYYKVPEGAAWFKLALQQSDLPEQTDDMFMAIHDDGSAKWCELKNTYAYNTAAGLFSVVGETDGLWIHNCYTNRDGMKPNDERTGDFENGWYQMRHSVVSNNIFKGINRNMGYFGASGGYNTFFHTNFIPYLPANNGNFEQGRLINNQIDTLWIKDVHLAHVYNNRLRSIEQKTDNVYALNNVTGVWVRSY